MAGTTKNYLSQIAYGKRNPSRILMRTLPTLTKERKMPTKAELEKENELLRELGQNAVTVSHCNFRGSPSGKVCKAVTQIAKTLEQAAKALAGEACIVIGKNKDE